MSRCSRELSTEYYEERSSMKIAIAGAGCIGLSNGAPLVQQNAVLCLDIIPENVAMLNHNKAFIVDTEIGDRL